MTHSKIFITSLAIATFSLSPAFADGHMEKKDGQHMDKTHSEKIMKKKTMSDVKTEMGDVKTEMSNETKATIQKPYKGTLRPDASVGTVLQEGTIATIPSDKDVMMYDGDLKMKSKVKAMDSDKMIKNNTIIVPSNTKALTTVTCPAGTTAQADMTCMITGDYKIE